MSNNSGIIINNGGIYGNAVALNGSATNYGSGSFEINAFPQAIEELRRAIPPQHAATVAEAMNALEAAANTAEPTKVKSTLQHVLDTLKSAGVTVNSITELIVPVAKIAGMLGTSLGSFGL